MQGRFAKLVFKRDQEGRDNARQRGMHARFQHKEPHNGAQQQRGRNAMRAFDVQIQQARQRQQRQHQVIHL